MISSVNLVIFGSAFGGGGGFEAEAEVNAEQRKQPTN
jgi:hypothetical protein